MDNPPNQAAINEFVVAAHHDLDKVQQMLAENPALLNETAEWIEMPIEAAAHTGQIEIARFLLDQGAMLGICTAAVMGMTDVVTAILAETPEAAQATGAHGIPVMFYPALTGHIDIATLLLDAGADINAGEGGNTALHGAAGGGQTGMVRWLLDHDANPYALDFNGKMPIDLAAEKDFTGIVDLLRPFTETP